VYCQFKSHNATIISEKLVAQFHEKAPACLSVTKGLRRLHFGEAILKPGIDPGRPSDGPIDFKIIAGLTAFPFHRVRTLPAILRIPPSTIWDHLRKGSFLVNDLRWVPQAFDAVTRRTRVTMAESLSTGSAPGLALLLDR
jgi:hypothetical protein